jgi:hypothetical protein
MRIVASVKTCDAGFGSIARRKFVPLGWSISFGRAGIVTSIVAVRTMAGARKRRFAEIPETVRKLYARFRGGQPCGAEAHTAKLTASGASWFAADMCLQTGGFGFAEEYDIERKFRETRLYQADLDQSDPQSCRDGCARAAQVVLIPR